MPGLGLIQPLHLLLLLLIVLVVFGAGKIGQVGAALGQSVKEFKETVNEAGSEEATTATSGATTPPAQEQARPVATQARELLRREEI
ncbi:MAG: twin-arginine translocase TatA/TatE family subunit [Thermomicrobiales bacterium]